MRAEPFQVSTGFHLSFSVVVRWVLVFSLIFFSFQEE